MTPPLSPTPSEILARQFRVTGRRALVTGGSMSIGRAIALGLAEAGADVAFQYAPAADAGLARADDAGATAAMLGERGAHSVSLPADFQVAGEARRCADAAIAALGGIDILVEITPAEVAREVAVNFSATIELLQAALPGMRARSWGRVLCIGSINATRPEPELGLYAALKAAQLTFILSLVAESAAHGVTLNTLSPGLVATERNRWRRADPAEWAAIQRRANPMGRAADPNELAGAALLLCSDAGAFITGADLQATGGGHV